LQNRTSSSVVISMSSRVGILKRGFLHYVLELTCIVVIASNYTRYLYCGGVEPFLWLFPCIQSSRVNKFLDVREMYHPAMSPIFCLH